jgi:hypothetical protein
MSDLKLGQLVIGEQHRDAIHIAVAPVVAGESLEPGAHVGLLPNGAAVCGYNAIGVVDPFLKQNVRKGQTFWLFLYPNTIKGLRHEWTHPAFEQVPTSASQAMSPSEEWLRAFALTCDGIGYDELMQAAERYLRTGAHFSQGGRFEGMYVPEEFWDHYEKATNTSVEGDQRGSFFTCSC